MNPSPYYRPPHPSNTRYAFSPRTLVVSALVVIALVRVAAQNGAIRQSNSFIRPQHITITGYDGDAMEPSLSPDGKVLLFNSQDDPTGTKKSLYWATRVDDRTFALKGPISAANSSNLQGTPCLDAANELFFVSPRTYDQTLSTVWMAKFDEGAVTDIHLVDGISPKIPGIVDMDVDVSADGQELVVSEATFKDGKLSKSKIVLFDRKGDRFEREADSDQMLKSVNIGVLNYAGTLSRDRRALYFTRALSFPQIKPGIYIATRRTTKFPFSTPRHMAAINGFAEAPALSPDGNALYYHAKLSGKFGIWRVTSRH